MTPTPVHTSRIAARTAGRIRLSRAIRLGGRGFALGGIAAVVLAMAAKWIPLDDRLSVVLPAAGLLIPLVGGLVLGALKRVPLAEAAGVLDEAHHLKDRLTSAVELAERGGRVGPFAELAIDEAERVASSVRADRAVPLRPGRAWLVGFACVAVAVGLWVLVPARAVHTPRVIAASSPEEREAAAERIEEVIEQLGPAGEADGTENGESVDALRALQERLKRGEMDPESALAAAAEQLEKEAEKKTTTAEMTRQAEQAIADAADRAASETDGLVRELAEALSGGDLDRARRAADQIRERGGAMPPEARERLARDLEKLARALEQNRPEPTETTPPMGTTDERELAEEFEKQGLDPASAQDMARRAAEAQRRRREAQRSAEDIDRLKEALDETARSVRTPPADHPKSDTPEETPKQDGQKSPLDKDDSQTGESDKPDAQNEHPGKKQGDQQDKKQGERRGDKPGERPGSEPKGPGAPSPVAPTQRDGARKEQPGKPGQGEQKPGDQSQPVQPQKKPGQNQQPGSKRGQQPSEKPGQQSDRPGAAPGSESENESQEKKASGEGSDQSTGKQPGAQSGEQPGAKPGDEPGHAQGEKPGSEPGEQPSGSGSGGGGPTGNGGDKGDEDNPLGRALDRLEQRRAEREMDERRAREMRRRAQELLDKATPEQRRRLEKLAERLTKRPPAEPWEAREEVVDARRKGPTDDREQVLAEWYNPDGEPVKGVDKTIPAARLREAASAAERAVEQQRVPSRYRKLVRDVFRQIQEKAAEEGGSSAPLSEDPEKKNGS